KTNRRRTRRSFGNHDFAQARRRRHHRHLLGAGTRRMDSGINSMDVDAESVLCLSNGSCPKNMGADRADALQKKKGETETHARLKRLALIFAQQNGYSACTTEVSLPRCRYRADVAAYRPAKSSSSSLSVVEAAVPAAV